MAGPHVEVRPTIDRAWLELEGTKDPVSHAYALWDLERFPQFVRFVSAIRNDTTVGYLLVWQPPGRSPVVQWVGEPLEELASALPPRPLIVVAPEGARTRVERARGPVEAHPIFVEAAAAGTRPPPTSRDAQVRRLTGADRDRVASLAQGATETAGLGYLGIDLSTEVVFGGFDRETLVGVARAVVRRPTVWLVGGVYVRPQDRSQGWGRALTRAVLAEAAMVGAPSALFVREDQLAARAVYGRLGFHPVGRRVWLDCGARLPP